MVELGKKTLKTFRICHNFFRSLFYVFNKEKLKYLIPNFFSIFLKECFYLELFGDNHTLGARTFEVFESLPACSLRIMEIFISNWPGITRLEKC